MSELTLSGIPGDLPIGAMAAFGVLRLCDHARLHWSEDSGRWRPVLTVDDDLTTEELVEVLAAAAGRVGDRPEMTWTEQVKSDSKEQFQQAARGATEEAREWFAAFATDIILTKDGVLVPSPFDMSVARQKFPADLVKLAMALSGDKAAFREALYGPWLYKDDQHSFGWDPTTMRLGAFTTQAPTKMANAGVRAAVWLAFESLPLFPCFCSEGKLRTRSFLANGRDLEFRWPVWQTPINLLTLKSLLASSELLADNGFEALRARGVVALYSSKRFKPNKYMISFRPPELMAL